MRPIIILARYSLPPIRSVPRVNRTIDTTALSKLFVIILCDEPWTRLIRKHPDDVSRQVYGTPLEYRRINCNISSNFRDVNKSYSLPSNNIVVQFRGGSGRILISQQCKCKEQNSRNETQRSTVDLKVSWAVHSYTVLLESIISLENLGVIGRRWEFKNVY